MCEFKRTLRSVPVNLLLKTVASDPKLRDDGNCLVEVYPTFDFIWFLGVYLLPCVWVYLARFINSIDRSVSHRHIRLLNHWLPPY
jgi:hypothetical protein